MCGVAPLGRSLCRNSRGKVPLLRITRHVNAISRCLSVFYPKYCCLILKLFFFPVDSGQKQHVPHLAHVPVHHQDQRIRDAGVSTRNSQLFKLKPPRRQRH